VAVAAPALDEADVLGAAREAGADFALPMVRVEVSLSTIDRGRRPNNSVRNVKKSYWLDGRCSTKLRMLRSAWGSVEVVCARNRDNWNILEPSSVTKQSVSVRKNATSPKDHTYIHTYTHTQVV